MANVCSDQPGYRCFWVLVVLIVLLGFAIRATAITRMPLFYDESFDIRNAHRFSGGQTFAGLSENKWLYSVIVGQFDPTGPEGVWVARTVSALFGALTVAACIGLGCYLSDRREGLLAGLFYAVLPMAVFHERQALVEPLVATFTACSMVLMAWLTRKQQWWLVPLLGVALAAAYMTKMLALPYLGLPIVAAALLARKRRGGWQALLLNSLAIELALGLIALVYQVAAQQEVAPGVRFRPTIGNTILGSFREPETLARLQRDGAVIGGILARYVGWIAVALVALAVVWAVLGERRREILFLMTPALAFGLIPLMARRTTSGDILAPRYFLTSAAPLAILAALSLHLTLKWLAVRWYRSTLGVGALLLLGMIGPALWFDLTLIRNPWQAPMTAIDRGVQYHMALHEGELQDVVRVLLEDWQAGDGKRIDLLGVGLEGILLNAYLGPRVVNVVTSPQAAEEGLAEWLAQGEQVFFVDGENIGGQNMVREPPEGALLELVGSYDVLTGTLDLYRVIGADGPLADEVYTRLVPDAERITDDYAALAATLEGPGPVLIFPAGHAPTLEALTNVEVIPLTVGAWPADLDAAEVALTGLALGEDGSPVELVLVDEASADPARTVALAAQRQLYEIDDAWFGYLHRLSYVTGPTEPAMTELNAQYEGVIELAQAAVLDPTVHPGDTVRVALRWRLSEPVRDSFVVFAHVVDEAGTLWAQHDSVPGGGLLPMTDWEPSQEVLDRFAIRLPPDLPAGEYVVWVGLYFPESGIRLAVTEGQEVGPDDVVIGRFACSPQKIDNRRNILILTQNGCGVSCAVE